MQGPQPCTRGKPATLCQEAEVKSSFSHHKTLTPCAGQVASPQGFGVGGEMLPLGVLPVSRGDEPAWLTACAGVLRLLQSEPDQQNQPHDE